MAVEGEVTGKREKVMKAYWHVGLVVAIPAIVIYNLLLRRVKVIILQWDIENG